jgi:hypothetical protein
MNNSSSERLTNLVQELDDPVLGAFLVKSIGHSEVTCPPGLCPVL